MSEQVASLERLRWNRRIMSVQLQTEQMPGYLVARFTGAGVAEDVWRHFDFIAEHCKRTKNNKLLIDTTRAEGEISLMERFLVAARARVFAYYCITVAFVELPERIDPQRFAELVARNREVNARVFSDLRAAEKWLLE